MAASLDFGLLWYDGDAKSTLTQKVERAVSRYEEKFGRRPNACYVHHALIDREIEWRGIRVVGAANILPNHFWVGVAHEPRALQ